MASNNTSSWWDAVRRYFGEVWAQAVDTSGRAQVVGTVIASGIIVAAAIWLAGDLAHIAANVALGFAAWVLVSFIAVVVVIGPFRVWRKNHARIGELEGDSARLARNLEAEVAARRAAEQERDHERSERQRLEAENETLKQPAGGTHVDTIHGPVGSIAQAGGLTVQNVNQPRTLAGKDLTACEERLRQHPVQAVFTSTPDGDRVFADELAAMAQRCRWPSGGDAGTLMYREINFTASGAVSPPPIRGVELRVPGNEFPDGFRELEACLQHWDFETHRTLNCPRPSPVPFVIVRGQ